MPCPHNRSLYRGNAAMFPRRRLLQSGCPSETSYHLLRPLPRHLPPTQTKRMLRAGQPASFVLGNLLSSLEGPRRDLLLVLHEDSPRHSSPERSSNGYLSSDREEDDSVGRCPCSGDSVGRCPCTCDSVGRCPCTCDFVGRCPYTRDSVGRCPCTCDSVGRCPRTCDYECGCPRTFDSVVKCPRTCDSVDKAK